MDSGVGARREVLAVGAAPTNRKDVAELVRIVQVLCDEERGLDERENVLRENALPWGPERSVVSDAALVRHRACKQVTMYI